MKSRLRAVSSSRSSTWRGSTGAPLPIVLLMFVNAAAVSAAAVLGRYHYTADAFAGWAVALVVWLGVRS